MNFISITSLWILMMIMTMMMMIDLFPPCFSFILSKYASSRVLSSNIQSNQEIISYHHSISIPSKSKYQLILSSSHITPISNNQVQVRRVQTIYKTVTIVSTLLSTQLGSTRKVEASTEVEKYSISIPPGWTILPRKIPTLTLSQYLSEEILLVASNFVEGVSLSVTRSNAQRLLKDFNVDWWFDKLNTIADVGNADLISRLLILQRQENFDGKSPSATILTSAIMKDQTLYFDFDTPVAEGVDRKSQAKAFFKDGYLYVLWISGLGSIFESDFSSVIKEIQESFHEI